jgi:hypothetical protein
VFSVLSFEKSFRKSGILEVFSMGAPLEKMLFVGSTKGHLFGELGSVSEKQEAVNCFRKIKEIKNKKSQKHFWVCRRHVGG